MSDKIREAAEAVLDEIWREDVRFPIIVRQMEALIAERDREITAADKARAELLEALRQETAEKMRLTVKLEAAEKHIEELEAEVEKWQCESHPWLTSAGDPDGLTPEKVRQLTDAELDARKIVAAP